MSEVKCMVTGCGCVMKGRINGSHLKRVHDLSLLEYKELYPNADLGAYKCEVFKCKICDMEMDGKSGIKVKHLRSHGLTVHEYNIQYFEKICMCGCGQKTEYSYKKHRYNGYIKGHCKPWNIDMHSTNTKVSKATKRTYKRIIRSAEEKAESSKRRSESAIKSWETNHDERAKQMTQKYKQTMNARFGVDNSFQSDEVKKKIESTMILKYGAKSPKQVKELNDKIIQTNIQRYGCENPAQNEIVKEKIRQTNTEKYGVPHVSQDGEISQRQMESSIKNRYEIILPSGRQILCQGFERFAIYDLLKIYDESQIISSRKEMPKIFYQRENKIRRYFPDFFIPHHNLIIEIKSDFTFNEYLDINTLKFNRCHELGYKILILIYFPKKEKYIIAKSNLDSALYEYIKNGFNLLIK